MLAYPPPQAAPSRARTSSDGFDFVGELYLEDDSWQLRPEFHKKRRLKSVIVFKTSGTVSPPFAFQVGQKQKVCRVDISSFGSTGGR